MQEYCEMFILCETVTYPNLRETFPNRKMTCCSTFTFVANKPNISQAGDSLTECHNVVPNTIPRYDRVGKFSNCAFVPYSFSVRARKAIYSVNCVDLSVHKWRPWKMPVIRVLR